MLMSLQENFYMKSNDIPTPNEITSNDISANDISANDIGTNDISANTMAPPNDLFGMAGLVEASLEATIDTPNNMGIVDELD